VSVYLDASILVPLFKDDRFSSRSEAFLDGNDQMLLVSDFAIAEFASAIARHVRMRNITEPEAPLAFAGFDAWTARAAQRIESATSDISAANSLLRRLDLPLRTPDAINIAIAQRLGAALATFDEKMAACARALGAPVAAA
jgi:predicted nucleic acid-binding protein